MSSIRDGARRNPPALPYASTLRRPLCRAGLFWAICTAAMPASAIEISLSSLTSDWLTRSHAHTLKYAIPGALTDIRSRASLDFYRTNYVNFAGGPGGFDMAGLNTGPMLTVAPLTDAFGEYRGFSGGPTDAIFLDADLVRIADDATDPNTRKAQELLEDTIGHELVHWADFYDNGINNNASTNPGAEEGNLWELAVYGVVKTWSNVTGRPNNPVPEPGTLLLMAAVGLSMLGARLAGSGSGSRASPTGGR